MDFRGYYHMDFPDCYRKGFPDCLPVVAVAEVVVEMEVDST